MTGQLLGGFTAPLEVVEADRTQRDRLPDGLHMEYDPAAVSRYPNGEIGGYTCHTIVAHVPTRKTLGGPSGQIQVGQITLDGQPESTHARSGGDGRHPNASRYVVGIQVERDYRRQGIATALWDHAKGLGLRPMHSDIQFGDGKHFAATVDPAQVFEESKRGT